MEKEHLLTIGDIAKAAGTTPRTVRFYEEIGLISPVKRTPNGYRLYGQDELQKLRLITALKRSGFQLKSVRALFDLKAAECTGGEAAVTVQRILRRHLADVEETLGSVRAARDDIRRTIEALEACVSCSKPVNEADCLNCERWKSVTKQGLTETLRFAWPGAV